MVLAQQSSLTADESPLTLLRLRRADAEDALRKSIVTSSMMALTFCVAVLLARALLWAPAELRVIDLPPTDWVDRVLDTPPIPTGDAPPAPPVTRPAGAVPVPVDKTLDDFADDIPAKVPIAQGSDSSGRVGAIAGPKTGGQAVQAPEVEPLPTEWVDELPDPVTRVKPDYPDIARNAGMEGSVLVRALVGLDGRVRRAEIERSAVMFDEAALAAVRQWTFTPAKSNGKAVMAWVRIPVKFTLH